MIELPVYFAVVQRSTAAQTLHDVLPYRLIGVWILAILVVCKSWDFLQLFLCGLGGGNEIVMEAEQHCHKEREENAVCNDNNAERKLCKCLGEIYFGFSAIGSRCLKFFNIQLLQLHMERQVMDS